MDCGRVVVGASALVVAAGALAMAPAGRPAPVTPPQDIIAADSDPAGGGSNPVPRDPPPPNGGLVNWENPHVHPADMTPDGSRLLVVNTPDNRIELFNLTPGGPVHTGAIPVGLDPISVRARTNDEVWVVNRASDSVSIVSLSTMNVVNTVRTDDEPSDVVFAGTPGRAFVSCSMANTVLVFDPANLAGAPSRIAIEGDRPRSLAVSLDGQTVYAAIFESGNRSTVIGGGAGGQNQNIAFPPNVVDDNNGPYGPNPGGQFNANTFGPNPPPNSGVAFSPPINGAVGSGLPVSLIVKKTTQGQWMDDNGHDWTAKVSGPPQGAGLPSAADSGRVPGWDLVDQDVAAISTSSLSVSYATGLMNICMSLSVNPGNGRITVVGTDGTNEVRYEPVVSGKFLKVLFSSVDAGNLSSHTTVDLNPHLTYATPSIPQVDRDRSIGDPRAVVWNGAGTRGYVTGMGSNNVVVIDGAGARAGLSDTINVGEGPTGAVLDEARGKLYVVNKFAASISVINTATEVETARVPFYDPSPASIKLGRKHLYDTHKNSGLGQIACASCHVDARMDRLAWDLGDPSGVFDPTNGQNLGMNLPGLNTGFQSFHPMKGPMTTQTLQDIIGQEPLHWRGDRDGLESFNGAFIGLQGDDTNLTPAEMQQYEDFLATITYPPNPYRNFDNTLPTSLPIPASIPKPGRFGGGGLPFDAPGNAVAGRDLYTSQTRLLDGGALACVTCHTLPTGAGGDVRVVTVIPFSYGPFPVGPNGEHHRALVSVDGVSNITIKTPHLRNEYEKVGFNAFSTRSLAGFGVLHDGSVDTLARFVAEPVFNVQSNQEVADLVAFILSFAGSDLPPGSNSTPFNPPGGASKDTPASVGWQTTVIDGSAVPPAQSTLINNMLTLANQGKVGVVVKGRQGGQQHGWMYRGGFEFESDQTNMPLHIIPSGQLLTFAAPGSELTYTVVPVGTQRRIGIDRDNDGALDSDEIQVCSDPADPAIFPGSIRSMDVNGDLLINSQDYFDFLNRFFAGNADFNGDGLTNSQDYFDYLNAFFAGC